MPSVSAFIQHGTLTNAGILDEPNILVTSLSITPAREEKLYKAGGVTRVARYTDPIITFGFSGIVKARTGLGDQHPGTAITSLANFSGSRHGFDPSDGVIIYKDPSVEETGEDPTQITFTATQYPFIE